MIDKLQNPLESQNKTSESTSDNSVPEKKLVDWESDQQDEVVLQDEKKPDDASKLEKNKSDKLSTEKQNKKTLEENNEDKKVKDTDSDDTDEEKEAWDLNPSSFQDEEQIHMSLKQELLYIRQSCNVMIEKNIASNDSKEAIKVIDSLIKTLEAPLAEKEE
ncbi:MAG: hypothetical protein HRT87_00175 [Legionellales bacterium]|nr:hypothetical protein [Legionellales bacterium]